MPLDSPSNQRDVVLLPPLPERGITVELAARNALPLPKMSSSLRGFKSGYERMKYAGQVSGEEVPEGATCTIAQAFDCLEAWVKSTKSTTRVPKGMDAASVEAFTALWSDYQHRAKSSEDEAFVESVKNTKVIFEK